MEKRYLFIAYKDDSVDICRGCLMASYSSDFFTRNHLTRKELVEIWAEYLLKDIELRIGESGYKYYIYNKGVQVYEDEYPRWDGMDQFDEDKYEEMEAVEKEEIAEIMNIKGEAQVLADKLNSEKRRKERERDLGNKLKETIARQEQRRKQYEELKEEFGDDK